MTAPEPAALGACRVLELAEDVAGEYCGKLLADFGAEVVKVERPGQGSPTRRMGPLRAGATPGENSALFAYLNTNKRSVVLDLASPERADLLRKLLDWADVVIDDHPAEWLERAGLAPASVEAQRPALVLCSITPFGLSPPPHRRHAEDLTVFHASGWGYHTPSAADERQPPLNGPVHLASYEAGFDAALCVAAALYEREASQRGRVIEISQHATLASRTDYVLAQMVAGDMDVSRRRDAFDLRGPAGIFTCRDGHVYLWMSTPGHWEALRQLLGDPAWIKDFPERWLERECTPERVATCREHVSAWLRNQDRHDVARRAQALGLIAAALDEAGDLYESPQYIHRGFFADVAHPALGTLRHPTVPYRLSVTPARIRARAPLLGEHSAASGPGAMARSARHG